MKFSKIQLATAAVATLGALLAVPAHAGKTVDAIKARGQVVCGVNTGLAGFAAADSAGKWSGLDIDVCKALAAATLGDAEKVKYVPLNAQQRFTALQSGEVDVLARNTTFTLTRDASLGLVGAFVDHGDAGIAQRLLDAVVGHVAISAQHLQRRTRGLKALIGEQSLDHRRQQRGRWQPAAQRGNQRNPP